MEKNSHKPTEIEKRFDNCNDKFDNASRISNQLFRNPDRITRISISLLMMTNDRPESKTLAKNITVTLNERDEFATLKPAIDNLTKLLWRKIREIGDELGQLPSLPEDSPQPQQPPQQNELPTLFNFDEYDDN